MLEIFFDDLCEEAQKNVLQEFSVRSPNEMNWDIAPLFVLECSDKEA
jgi:hypothetical protein